MSAPQTTPEPFGRGLDWRLVQRAAEKTRIAEADEPLRLMPDDVDQLQQLVRAERPLDWWEMVSPISGMFLILCGMATQTDSGLRIVTPYGRAFAKQRGIE